VEGETDDDGSADSADGRPRSGLFLLQGPPGTGKTTTTAALIAELALRYRDTSLLICAPSNQALRELLLRVNELFVRHPPDEVPPMALVGVAKKLPPALDNVYAHKFASRLSKPLIDLKRQLRALLRRAHRFDDELPIARAIREHCAAVVLPGIDGLVVGRSPFHVRRHVQTAVQKLRLEVRAAVANVVAAEADRLVAATETLVALLQAGAKTCELFVVQRAQIVFATLVGSGRPWLRKQRDAFDVVVVDEAGQALVPEVAIPLHFAPQLMVQVGDPQQLAPVVKAVDATHVFAQSMMQLLMGAHAQPFARLHVQYRMHPAICAWVSDTFYDGALVTDASVAARPSLRAQFPRLDARLDAPSLFIDVARGAEARGDGRSWRNEEEARLVVGALVYLLRHCAVPAERVGVVSFYASQVALLKTLLATRLEHELRGGRITRDQRRAWARVLVHTVDGFQGGECALTLVSCVRSTAAVGFLSNARRLNVAMSRAQSARWVFGHGAGLRGAADTVLPSFLATHRAPLPAETLAAIVGGPATGAGGGVTVAAPARVLRRAGGA
jgi:senataxin